MTDPAIEAATLAYSELARERGIAKREVTVPDLLDAVVAAVRPLIIEEAAQAIKRSNEERAASPPAVNGATWVRGFIAGNTKALLAVRGLAGPLTDGGLIAPIPEHLFKCPSDCTDETPIVSVGWSTPTREVKPWDEDFDPGSPFVQHKPDPDNNTTNATHASGLEHELPYDTRIGTSFRRGGQVSDEAEKGTG